MWGFKDPRTCLTLPFWRPLIGPAAFVICHRHPLEIADSLLRRDALTTEQSIALWRRYTAGAIAATADDPRVIIGYRSELGDPFAACQKLASFLGVPECAGDPSVRREVDGWVDHGLRHHEHTALELLDDARLGPRDVSLALLLDLATAAGDVRGELDDALNETARRMLRDIATPGAGE